MPKGDRRDPPQGTLAMVAESIKKAVRQGVNSDIQDTITKLETQQRLPEVRHDVNVTLEGTVKLEAAYVQMHGPLPQPSALSVRKATVHFKSAFLQILVRRRKSWEGRAPTASMRRDIGKTNAVSETRVNVSSARHLVPY